jgi:signal peptidase I
MSRPGWLRLLAGRLPRRALLRGALLAAAAAVVFTWALLPVRTHGPSMLPSYPPRGLAVVNTLSYWRGAPGRGEVVAIRLAGPNLVYIKRIVGLPGEAIRIDQGVVYVNDRPLDEPYVKHRAPWSVPSVSLTSEEYYVIGDNRGMAREDHLFGTTSRDRILGRVIF